MLPLDVGVVLISFLAVLIALLLFGKIMGDVDFGVWLLILFFPFMQMRVVDTPFGSLQPSQLLVILTLISVFFREAIKKEGLEITSTPINTAVIIFLVIGLFSLAQLMFFDFTGVMRNMPLTRSGRVDPVVRGLTTIINMLIGMATFYLIVGRLKTAAAVKKGIVFWVASGAVASLFGIYTFFGSLVRFLPALPPFLVGGQSGITPRELDMMNPLGSPLVPRVASVLQEPRHLAIFLAPIIFFLLMLLINKKYLVRPWIQQSTTAVIVTAFILTLSRITLILGVAILVAYVLVARGRPHGSYAGKSGASIKVIMPLSVLAIVATNLLLNYILDINLIDFIAFQWASVIGGERLSYFTEQMEAFRTAWQTFISHPFLGGGIGSFYYFVKIYSVGSETVVVNNIYLEIMAETGLAGIIAFLFILFSYAKGLKVAGRQDQENTQSVFISGFKGSFLVLLVGYLFYSAFFFPFVWGIMGLGAAYALTARTQSWEAT